MSHDDQLDLAEFIHEFLTGLPDTIRTEILVSVLIYGCDGEPGHPNELGEAIRKELLDRRGMRRLGAVLRVRAAVDFVLMQRVTVTHRNQASPLTIPSHMQVSEAVRHSIETMQLRGPLMIRHLEDAQRRWNVFCEQHMNPLDLIEYQERIMRR